MVQNSEFYQASQAWLQAALQFLRDKPLPYKETLQVTFNPNGYNTQGGVFTIDYFRLSTMYLSQLIALPEYSTIFDLVTNTPVLSTILLGGFGGNIISDQVEHQKAWIGRAFFTLLSEYLQRKDDLTFSPEIFDRIYGQLEQYIYSAEPFRGIWLVHIRNLKLEIERIRIDHNLYLRQATEEEKVDVIRKGSNFSYLSHLTDLSDITYLSMVPVPDVPDAFLEIQHPVERIYIPNEQEALQIAQTVILALRLVKDNPVGIASYRWSLLDQPFLFPNKFYYPNINLPPFAFTGERYIFTQEDATVLPKLYKKAKKAYKNSELTTAITRFEDSYTRAKAEDKLIDYWVALEALFFSLIPKEYVGSMGDTVASNTAYYVGNSESERRRIYAFIYSSHKARGYFVHGQRGTAPEKLDLTIKKTGQYLRTALRKRIEE